mgnify:CR=1 FL=1
MPTLAIDGREVAVPSGTTILQAARKLGIEVPTLCYLEGLAPQTSCLVCTVRLEGNGRLVPSCGMLAEEGMRVDTRSEEVRRARKTALELLLGDHAGDCLAPCQTICPAQMDIPTMLRRIAAGDFAEAAATVKEKIALPGVLARICPKPCEKGCRRAASGGAVSVCLLKGAAADFDLARASPREPERRPPAGRRVAVVGSGPAGLAAAYYLGLWGYEVEVFEAETEPGGGLSHPVGEGRLPRAVLDAEIDAVRRLGVRFRLGTRVGEDISLEELRSEFDAVFLAPGPLDAEGLARLGVSGTAGRFPANPRTFETPLERVFAGGGILRRGRLAVRSVAEGRAAAVSIDQALRGLPVAGPEEPFANRLRDLGVDELVELASLAAPGPRIEPARGPVEGFSPEEARAEAARCLGCDCRKLADCRLRAYAAEYGADPSRFRGERRQVEIVRLGGGIVFEAGKCISCGLCIQIAERGGERLGLAFVGRGFRMRVAVPFGRSFAEGLEKTAAACVEACPTGALSWEAR